MWKEQKSRYTFIKAFRYLKKKSHTHVGSPLVGRDPG